MGAGMRETSTTLTVRFPLGTSIDSAARQLVEAAAQSERRVTAEFNGVELIAGPFTAREAIVGAFLRETERRAEAYRRSPTGRAAARESARDIKRLQATHDALVRRLADLPWQQPSTVLEWLCDMQEPSDRIGVSVAREAAVEAFEAQGFVANANTDDAFDGEDADNVYRWLVGQALDGLKRGRGIHPAVPKFADDWKAKFAAPTPGGSDA